MDAQPNYNYDFLINSLSGPVPDLAKSLQIIRQLPMTEVQFWASCLAAAWVSRNELVLACFEAEAREHLAPEQMKAVAGIASTMAMNNVFGRFSHVVSDPFYHDQLPKLSAKALVDKSLTPLEAEFCMTAVSVVFGCGRCIDGHAAKVIAAGSSREQVTDIARVAAAVHAVAVTIDAIEGSEIFAR